MSNPSHTILSVHTPSSHSLSHNAIDSARSDSPSFHPASGPNSLTSYNHSESPSSRTLSPFHKEHDYKNGNRTDISKDDSEPDPIPVWADTKTKAGKDRKRLPLACIACRRKKTKCTVSDQNPVSYINIDGARGKHRHASTASAHAPHVCTRLQ